MPLFEVAMIEKPTKKQQEDGQGEKLVMPPRAVLAKDQNSAAIIAVMDGGLAPEVDRTRLEVLVRPFA